MRRIHHVSTGVVAAALVFGLLSGASAGTYDLSIGATTIDVTGTPRPALAINGGVPGPVLRFREGEDLVINVANTLGVDTSIHWHGLIVPTAQDGVPGISFDGIKPGTTHTYRFPAQQSGTYWYHSHSGLQEQAGVYGAIVVEPVKREPFRFDRDYVVLLSDFHDDKPERIRANLKKQSDYYNYSQRTTGDFLKDTARNGLDATVEERKMWGEMRMMPTDITDVAGYTYLVNGSNPDRNWTALFKPGERVRLRFVNAAAMTYFDVRIPGLKMTVVQADGNNVQPVSVDEFRIAVAETYDVIVRPEDDAAYTIFAETMSRTGFARATLAPRDGMAGGVPELRPPPLLTMADMAMSDGEMAGMDHSSMKGMDDASTKGMDDASMKGMDHSSMKGMDDASMKGMDDASMKSMDHSSMKGMDDASMKSMDHSSMKGMDDASMKGMDDASMKGMDHSTMKGMDHSTMAGGVKADPFYAPGSGLMPKAAAEGGRFLSYADLKAQKPLYKERPATREIEIRLTGNMERYVWSINDVKYSDAEPIRLKYGERVRFKFVNETMMSHPMHLHGMWTILDNGSGKSNPIKHTVNVAPGTTVYTETEVDAPGAWAFHCHLMYHMAAGMFRMVIVEGGPQAAALPEGQ